MVSMLKQHTTEQIQEMADRHAGLAGILREIGYKAVTGKIHKQLKQRIQAEGIDVTRMRSNRSDQIRKLHAGNPAKPLKEVLVIGSTYSRKDVKRRVIDEGLLETKCAECGQGPEWQGKDMVLVLDHINGVNNDHRLENLRMLCPNCNSQTATFTGRNTVRSPKMEKMCRHCGESMMLTKSQASKRKFCSRSCSSKSEERIHLRKTVKPPPHVLKKEIQDMTWVALGKRYGVSDNAVRKWARGYGLLQ